MVKEETMRTGKYVQISCAAKVKWEDMPLRYCLDVVRSVDRTNGLSVEKRIIRRVRSQDDESDRNKIDSKSI